MNAARATLAIVQRQCDRWLALDIVIASGLGVVLAIFALRAIPADAGVAIFAVAVAAGAPHADRIRDLTYFTLPLYGRQLARAHAIVPVLSAGLPVLAFAAASALTGRPVTPPTLALAALAAGVTALVSLSAEFREGRRRVAFMALSYVAGYAVEAAALAPNAARVPLVLGLAIVFGYVALRQLGETLARFDSLPDDSLLYAG